MNGPRWNRMNGDRPRILVTRHSADSLKECELVKYAEEVMLAYDSGITRGPVFSVLVMTARFVILCFEVGQTHTFCAYEGSMQSQEWTCVSCSTLEE